MPTPTPTEPRPLARALLPWILLLLGLAALAALGVHELRRAAAPLQRSARSLQARPPAAAAPVASSASPTNAAPRTPGSGAAGAGAAAAGSTPGAGPAAAQAPASGPSSLKITVARNDTLDRIFRRLQLSLADLASLRNLPGLRRQLDKLRPGEALTITHRQGELLGLERRLSLEETLKVQRDAGGLHATVVRNPLEMRERTVSATIDSSLFEATTQAGAHDQTAMALADIFAWDIDFVLDIQPGDSFTVTYEEIYENGKYLQDGPVLAARFINQGREYLAVRYTPPDGHPGYYTPDGRSLRKAFLRAPLEFTRVSSPFNLHRKHPILNTIRAHKGIDYAAPIGTPVKAAGDGRVIFAGQMGGYGNVVQIDHAHGIVTVYGHLSRFAHGLRVGEHVQQGAIIAYVGMTGLATGPHLHYEYRVNGVHKNPQTVGLPDAMPIEASLRPDFQAKTEPLLASLYPPSGATLVAR
ncbi:MAG TPA: peptidoglycan DD-metalloendopeptidase family protein [Steroidobacteraceae bacterium]|nr:peptidoglycan DD-metalloendopeptidase family protein [Steroidobacteraceae bacterium]